MKFLVAWCLLVAAPLAQGLDLTLKSFTCDESMPFYAVKLTMSCNGNTKCTFGDTATISGELVYNDALNSGLVDDTVYATSVLQLMTLEYRLFQQLPLNVCGKWVTSADTQSVSSEAAEDDGGRRRLADVEDEADDADDPEDAAEDAGAAEDEGAAEDAGAADEGEASSTDDAVRDDQCPENGNYAFQVTYTLPSAEEKTAWLATGWTGSGEVELFAEENNANSLIGYCKLKLGTSVTPSASQGMKTPSALTASFIAVGVVAALLMLCIYCSCCLTYRRPPRNKEYLERDPIENDRSRDAEADYQSMTDSKPWTSTGSKSSSKRGWT